MSCSVALCTFNGELFLQTQLDSLASQTLRPAELVVCDDGSRDGTVPILQRFKETAPFPVHLTVNPRNLGSTVNFQQAIEKCSGEVIALCDQDDRWLPEKVDRIDQAMRADPHVGFVFSDATLIDELGKELSGRLWNCVWFDRAGQQQMTNGLGVRYLLKKYAATGATMAFRAQYRDLILPIPPDWIHDAWIAFLLAAIAPVELISDPLIQYRQHSGQQIGAKKMSWRERLEFVRQLPSDEQLAAANRFRDAKNRLQERAFHRCPAELFRELDRKISHCERRNRFRSRRWDLPALIREVLSGCYSRYSFGWKSVVQDLVF